MNRGGAFVGLAILSVLWAAPASSAPAAGKVFRIGYLYRNSQLSSNVTRADSWERSRK